MNTAVQKLARHHAHPALLFCGSSFLPPSNRWARLSSALTLAAIVLGGHSASAATPTVTSLNLSSGSVSAGTASTFTATVTSAVTGSVTFCNANATFCTGSNLLQQVQVTAAGTARFRKVFGAGTYSVKAIFSGTSALASSSSSAVSLTVTGNGSYATETSIAATGNPGSYTLAGTVTASGRILPNGSVSFLDTTASNAVVATSALDPTTHGFNFTSFPTLSLPSYAVATGDFNEDGKLDLVTADGGIQIALGNGDGTFGAPTSYPAATSTRLVAVYDINGDGHLDLITLGSQNLTNYQSYLAVLLGNGDGTFQAALSPVYAGHESLGLALGDFNGDGIADIVTANAGIDNTVGVFLGNGNGTFQSRVTYPVTGTYGVSLGDVNGDGYPDLIVPTATGISVLLGAGDGTFATAVAHAGGSISEQAVVGDFNADGKLDVATANFGSNNMTVFLGNGDGTFQPAAAYATNLHAGPPGSDPVRIASGDFNGDGIQDLAVGATYEGGSYFLGNGDGTFQPLGALNTLGPSFTAYNLGIVSGDFDGDGLDDLAVAEELDGLTVVLLAQQTVVATSTGVSVPGPAVQQVDASYPGDAEHISSVSPAVPLLPLPSAVSLAASPVGAVPGAPVTLRATITPTPTGAGSAGTVSFYNGSTLLSTVNVTGSTAVYVTTTLPAGYSNISAAYSGNIVLAPSTSSTLRIFIGGQTSIALTLSATTAAVHTPITLTATATTLPGGALLTPGQVTFQYQQTAGSVTIPGSFGSVQLSSAGTATVVAVPSAGAYEVTAVFSGTATEGPSSSAPQALTISGNGGYATTTSLVASGSIGDYTLAATVTGFGVAVPGSLVSFLDTTAANAGIATATLDPVSVITGMLPASGSPLTIANAQVTASGDLNGDGIADLVSATCGGANGTVSVQLGVGDGTFQPAVPYTLSCLAVVAIGDVNGDGKPDLIAVSQPAGTVSILLGSGNGTFTLQPNPLQVGSNFPNAQPDAVAVADLNEDGKLDIVVANGAETDVAVFLGNGDGTFGAEQLFAVGNGANSVAVADLNGDGAPDLMVANQGDGTISVLLGSGNGTFQPQTILTYPYGDSAGLLAVGSLRGNGVIDLIAPDLYDPSVFIYLGNNDGTFAAPVGLNLNLNTGMAAVVTDLNHDGKLDLAVSTFGEIGVFYGVGDGTFAAETDYSTGQASGQGYVAIIAADLNNDGLIDLITTDSVDNTQAFLLGQQSATATASAVYVTGSGAQVVDASFPGDGTHAASVSNTVTLQPSVQAASSTSLATANANIATGSMATFTATVTPIPTGPSYGTIGFYNGGVLLGVEAVNVSGVATYSTSSLPAGADAITAVYSGNATSALSTSGVVTETVKTSTATNLSASTVTATSGQPVTLSATVTPASTDTTRGTVSFYAGSTLLGSSPLSAGGTTTLSTSALPLGTDTVTAVYSGSSDFAGSTSNGLAIAVAKAATTTLVTTSTATPGYGISFTLTATVTPASTDSPAGTVSFYQGTTLLGASAASAGGVATLSVQLTTLGANAITASYSGSLNFGPSTSAALSIHVVPAATTTVIGSSNQNPAYGATITLTATVAPASTDTPPGTVSFYTGTTRLGTAPLNTVGVATLSVSSLTGGLNLITAVYTGSVDFAGSTSGALSVSSGLPTATVVSSSTPAPAYGQAFTLNATVTPASIDTPPGTVSFYSGAVLLGSRPLSAGGVATLSASLLVVGPNPITAVYSGSPRYASSTSAALSITVVPAASSTAVSASNLAPVLGQTVTLNATVTSASAAGAGGIPGTVSFYSGTTLLGSSPLAGGVASLTPVQLPLGPNTVTAVYAGSADYSGSSSAALSVSVRTNTTVTFSASPTTQLYNNPIALTAQVSAAVGGVPTGTVTFLDGTTAVATATVGPGGQATYSDSGLSDGSHNLTAAYSGDTSFLSSVSSGAGVAITVGNLNLALGGDKNKTVVPGGAVTYNFPLSPLVTPTFLYVVHLTATGLPPGATYTFTPASIPAGSGPMPVAFTVQTAAPTAMLGRPRGPWVALVLVLLLPLAGARRFRSRLALVAVLGLGAALGLGGCGSGGFLGSPKGPTSYTITITATSADLVRTGTVQLNLE